MAKIVNLFDINGRKTLSCTTCRRSFSDKESPYTTRCPICLEPLEFAPDEYWNTIKTEDGKYKAVPLYTEDDLEGMLDKPTSYDEWLNRKVDERRGK